MARPYGPWFRGRTKSQAEEPNHGPLLTNVIRCCVVVTYLIEGHSKDRLHAKFITAGRDVIC